jgi:hypothetical protein
MVKDKDDTEERRGGTQTTSNKFHTNSLTRVRVRKVIPGSAIKICATEM